MEAKVKKIDEADRDPDQEHSQDLSADEELQKLRKSLPIYPYRNDILNALKANQILIVVGETGSGKSTQISQYLDEGGFTDGGLRVGITQPRRVGAVTVAQRVAQESGCSIGEEVGYAVRFTDKTSSRTRIKYMTDGVLLRECLLDHDLKEYSVIVLDEAHERSVHTDILFGLMKQTIQRRKDLRLLITSATLDAEKFSAFFNSCPIFFVPGRSFPVDIFYMEEASLKPDYIESSLETIFKIHGSEPDGDILLFLTGQQEIEQAKRLIDKRMDELIEKNPQIPDLIPLPLYAALPPGEQVKVFQPAPPNSRKVVIATNIAETSLTVNGIVYVIDPGYVKQTGYSATTGMETLQVCYISQVAAQQRAGRAGRTRPGKCYRLYTKETYGNQFEPITVPEIQRTNLANVVLTLKAMGIKDVLGFDFLDPPDPFLLVQATKHLFFLGALDEDGGLTEIGRQMSAFPLEPSYSRMLLAAVDYKVSEEMLSLIGMMSIENLFYRPSDKQQQEEAEELRKELYLDADLKLKNNMSGDHFFLLHLYNKWLDHRKSRGWCKDNFIQARHMEEAHEIRSQVADIMKQQRIEVLSSSRGNDTKYERLCKAICAGLYMNTSRRVSNTSTKKHGASVDYLYHIVHQNQTASVHPQSPILYSDREPPEWVVFNELVMTTRPFIRLVCGIQYQWVESLLDKRLKLDINRLIGRNFKLLLQEIQEKKDQEKEQKEAKDEAEIKQKFARRNDDSSVNAARERFLKRAKHTK